MAREHLFASALLGRTLTVCLVLCTSAAVGRAQAPSDVVIDDGLTWVEAITDNRSDPDNVSFRPGVRLVLRYSGRPTEVAREFDEVGVPSAAAETPEIDEDGLDDSVLETDVDDDDVSQLITDGSDPDETAG